MTSLIPTLSDEFEISSNSSDDDKFVEEFKADLDQL